MTYANKPQGHKAPMPQNVSPDRLTTIYLEPQSADQWGFRISPDGTAHPDGDVIVWTTTDQAKSQSLIAQWITAHHPDWKIVHELPPASRFFALDPTRPEGKWSR